jgi:hypothetical protein
MKDLGDLLNRFKRSLDKDVEGREAVTTCVRDLLGFDIRLQDVTFKAHTIRIKTSPAKRNAIKLEEERLLSLIRLKTNLNIDRILY